MKASFVFSPSAGCKGMQVTFTDTSTTVPNVWGDPAITNWEWDFGDQSAHVWKVQNPTHQYDTAGTYYPMLTIYNGFGMTYTTSPQPVEVGNCIKEVVYPVRESPYNRDNWLSRMLHRPISFPWEPTPVPTQEPVPAPDTSTGRGFFADILLFPANIMNIFTPQPPPGQDGSGSKFERIITETPVPAPAKYFQPPGAATTTPVPAPYGGTPTPAPVFTPIAAPGMIGRAAELAFTPEPTITPPGAGCVTLSVIRPDLREVIIPANIRPVINDTCMNTLCNGVCTDTMSDADNCGSCGNTCPQGVPCVSGVCFRPVIVKCIYPTTSCSGSCVDIQTDSANCGSCGNTCETGSFCENGRCCRITGINPMTKEIRKACV